MYDVINALSAPTGGDLYAGYVDGQWPSANALSERFRHALVVRIAVSPATNDGVVGDGPPDNGSWAEWVGWVQRRRAAHVDPTMYTNASSWAAGIAAFKAAGVTQPHWWIANYDGDPTIPSGAVAKQYASNNAYDTSSVADYWPGVDPAPPIPTPPVTSAASAILEEDPMLIESLSQHPDEYTAIVPSGIGTLVVAAGGETRGPASLKVTPWDNDKAQAPITVSVGGSAPHRVIGHPLAGADAVTVQRLDHETYTVAVGFRA
jgi:hypothetical protein